MDIEVNIPSVSIAGGIGRDLLNNGINPPDDDLESQIKGVVMDKFIHKYDQNKRLLEHTDLQRKICIEVQDDIGEVRPRMLASFNLYRSNMTGDIHFSVSSHLVYSELLAKYGIHHPEYHLLYEGYWSHEFVHLLDWHLLNKYYAEYETSRKARRVSSLFSSLPGNDEYLLPREWEVLGALASYRDEGLAVLYEYLCGEAELEISGNQAEALFAREAGVLLAYAHRDFENWGGQHTHPEVFVNWINQFQEFPHFLSA